MSALVKHSHISSVRCFLLFFILLSFFFYSFRKYVCISVEALQIILYLTLTSILEFIFVGLYKDLVKLFPGYHHPCLIIMECLLFKLHEFFCPVSVPLITTSAFVSW